jgi:hypothetical protein
MSGSPVKDEIQRRPAAAPAVHQPARLGGDRRGRRSAAAVSRRHHARRGLRPRGCGLEIAARTGARLVRLDFSAEAVRQACEHAWRLGRTGGLPPGESRRDRPGRRLGRRHAMRGRYPVLPAARRRLLRATAVLGPGGRAVLTCWEPLGQGGERLPGRMARVDLAARLTAAGFSNMEVRDRLGWRACERAMWQEAAALDPGDGPALQSFHDGRHALPRNPRPYYAGSSPPPPRR